MRTSPRPKNAAFITKSSLPGMLGFALLAALLVLMGYGFFFLHSNLDPRFLEPTLPMYQAATTLATLTLILCVYVYLLFERSDHHERFFTDYLSANKRLLIAIGISLAGFCLAVYLPLLQSIFGTATLDITDWATAIFLANIFACCRLLQRHTRKHTRHAVVRLHREIN